MAWRVAHTMRRCWCCPCCDRRLPAEITMAFFTIGRGLVRAQGADSRVGRRRDNLQRSSSMTTTPSLHGLSYYQVDVFTHEALAGNGLAVFLPDSPLPARAMQRLTIEMRQFESIFLTPDGPG